MIVEKMHENPQIVKLGSIGLSILIILAIFVTLSGKAKTVAKSNQDKKDSKKKTWEEYYKGPKNSCNN